MANAFSELGHDVEIVSLVSTDTEIENASRDAGWQKIVRRIPLAYELVQLGYNIVGIPLLATRLTGQADRFPIRALLLV